MKKMLSILMIGWEDLERRDGRRRNEKVSWKGGWELDFLEICGLDYSLDFILISFWKL